MNFIIKRLDIDIYLSDEQNIFFNNVDFLFDLVDMICEKIDTKRLESLVHKFKPYGITMLTVVSDSSINIHTYPEKNFASVEIHTCGENVKILEALKIFDRIVDKYTYKFSTHDV